MAVYLMMSKQKSDIMLFSFILAQAQHKCSSSLFLSELGSRNILYKLYFWFAGSKEFLSEMKEFCPFFLKGTIPHL